MCLPSQAAFSQVPLTLDIFPTHLEMTSLLILLLSLIIPLSLPTSPWTRLTRHAVLNRAQNSPVPLRTVWSASCHWTKFKVSIGWPHVPFEMGQDCCLLSQLKQDVCATNPEWWVVPGFHSLTPCSSFSSYFVKALIQSHYFSMNL